MANLLRINECWLVYLMKQVESPNDARAYGTGEVILIDVIFSQEVVLTGEPTLKLETGVFNQEVTATIIEIRNHRIFLVA